MIECNNTHTCSFCNSNQLSLVVDFGEVALAGAFLKPEQFEHEKKYRLQVCFCHDCYAVQVVNKIDPEILFESYFYSSSSIKTLCDHFRSYAEEVTKQFLSTPQNMTVLEFGCNDGVLLRPLADQAIGTVIGVDPAKNIVNNIKDSRVKIVNDFFSEDVAKAITDQYGKIDIIMANNVYAHIPDIQGTTRAISTALKDDGVFIFEVHYLDKIISEMQYDMIYHEHLYYYSLLSAQKHFDRYGMMIFDVKPIPIHAGSMRFYVCKKGSYHSNFISERVKNLELDERAKGFDRYETFQRFSDKLDSHRKELTATLEKLKQSGKKIVGYGASGRANTMIQFCGINHSHLDCIIDDAPAKKGYYTPGSHFEVVSNEVLSGENSPDYLLVFAWSFFEEIKKRSVGYLEKGGRMIVPLPEITVY